MIEFLMFSKDLCHIKGMLDKTLNVLEEMSCRHKKNLDDGIKLKCINGDYNNNCLIYEIISLLKSSNNNN